MQSENGQTGQNPVANTAGLSLEGRVALVTGAAGGLGKAIVARLRQHGAKVHGADVAGDGVIVGDLSTANGNRQVISEVIEASGRLDILVLNAGCQYVAPLDQFPDFEWERLRSVMMDGPFYALKEAWPHLARSGNGRVVVTASSASWGGAPQKAGYVAAKHGVLGLVRVGAREGAAHNITVNAIAPGWMDTAMMRGQLQAQAASRGLTPDEVVDQFRAAQPGNRFIAVAEVAEVVGFLASSLASGVSGACIPIDLGASA